MRAADEDLDADGGTALWGLLRMFAMELNALCASCLLWLAVLTCIAGHKLRVGIQEAAAVQT